MLKHKINRDFFRILNENLILKYLNKDELNSIFILNFLHL